MPPLTASWRSIPARSLAGAILAVKREVQVRFDFYPKRVRKGKMSAEYAKWESEAMLHAQDLLERMGEGKEGANHIPKPQNPNQQSAEPLDEEARAVIPAHELAHLADTWRNQAKDYCGQGLSIALESCALDLSRLVAAYSPNDQDQPLGNTQ